MLKRHFITFYFPDNYHSTLDTLKDHYHLLFTTTPSYNQKFVKKKKYSPTYFFSLQGQHLTSLYLKHQSLVNELHNNLPYFYHPSLENFPLLHSFSLFKGIIPCMEAIRQ